ncbi:hypothetical protein [Variovorax sp. JS1663]|uniref:hypothetical protein n=1 Tax=Variovorax sp. JS1663 TaxID=1851577 RepID=UPI000B646DB9|nr:hypothetical protein [Variovorax sp. JS1663]OUM00042.1 hypothetical protein A8M77_22925 [Variovorax sp. JS1663]
MKKTSIDQNSLAELPQQIRDAARAMAVYEAESFDRIVGHPRHQWAVAPAWMDPNEVAWRAHWFATELEAIADWAVGFADQFGIKRAASGV